LECRLNKVTVIKLEIADEISAQDIFEMESSSDELLTRLYRALDNTKKAE
jgi:hypothetical protein